MYNETTRLVRVIAVPLVADENEDVLVEAELGGGGQKGGATKEPVRGESDDEQTGVTYKLSDTAWNLWISDEVVAEFTDDNGKTHYAQLAKKEIANKSVKSDDAPPVFRFTFDSGDEFECENADDYPTLTTPESGLLMTGAVPYGAGGGSGGGGLIVTGTISGRYITLDKTWQEIHDVGCGTIISVSENTIAALFIHSITGMSGLYGINAIMFRDDGDGLAPVQMSFTTNSATGYPSMEM